MMKKRLYFLIAFMVMAFMALGQTDGRTLSDYVDDVGSQGAQNAVKKAHQMTDLEFVPLDTIVANKSKTYLPNNKYKGVIYSSVKETNTFVGLDVSFHTFMTALHNPRSVLYLENVSLHPYHGKNAAAYYGSVCSALVSYALGLNVYHKTYDFSDSEDMILVEDPLAEGIQLADVMCTNSTGHVAIITGIRRDKETGTVVRVEYCEAINSGCRRVVKNGPKEVKQLFIDGKRKVYRYKHLERNKYTPLTEFVAVEGEQSKPFKYNEDLCPNRGDKSCYISGDDVVLNILGGGFDMMEIYKGSKKYNTIIINGDSDIVLKDLPYGDYKAKLKAKGAESEFVYWKVIDVQVNANAEKETVSFHSENAKPVYLEFCDVTGSRQAWAWYVLTDEDISNGFVKISALPLSDKLKAETSKMYVKVHFECEYGKVINKPILWNKNKK